jgi:hypothetical protein
MVFSMADASLGTVNQLCTLVGRLVARSDHPKAGRCERCLTMLHEDHGETRDGGILGCRNLDKA